MKTIEKFFDALVNEVVMADVPGPVLELFFGGQFALKKQVRGFKVGAFFHEFFNGIAAVAQNSLVAIDIGNAADAGSGVVVSGIVTHHAEIGGIGLNLAKIHGFDGAVGDGHVVSFASAIVGDGEGFARVRGGIRFFGSGSGR